MKLNTQRRIAAKIMKRGTNAVRFAPAQLNDIKEAITTSDMRLLVSDGVVSAIPKRGVSRVRARKIHAQKRKGLRRGAGSRKGSPSAAMDSKDRWMLQIRSQRKFLAELKEKKLVTNTAYRELYLKAKGGFFRSIRHIKLFMDDKRLWQKPEQTAKTPKKKAKTE